MIRAVRRRRSREPAAPTPLDEALSRASLESSPWVVARIRELGLQGRLVHGWTPPVVAMAEVVSGRPAAS